MLSLLALAASTLLGVGIVAALTAALYVLLPQPDDFGTPAERHERHRATYDRSHP